VKISVVSYQKGRSPALETAEQEYVKRLSRHATVELCPVRRWDARTGVPARLLGAHRLVGLSVEGERFSSEGLARRLQALMSQGCSHLVLVVGGPEGIPAGAAAQIQEHWSLSPLTFSHPLARLLLLEALYRSFDLLHGGPYHK
jgi:23S rRNA (pseudouridine1915-N3)-methyltransferase